MKLYLGLNVVLLLNIVYCFDQEIIDSILWTTVEPFMELLFPVILEQLQIQDHTLEDALLKKKYDRIAKALDILLDILFGW